jgi:hypothetical protein
VGDPLSVYGELEHRALQRRLEYEGKGRVLVKRWLISPRVLVKDVRAPEWDVDASMREFGLDR